MKFYRIISIILLPIIAFIMLWRVFKGKENKSHIKEKFGFATVKKPKNDIIWIHAVSVGEMNSSLKIVDEILKNNAELIVLFTTTSITSAALMAKKIPEYQGRLIHQFFAIDSLFCVKKFLNHWKPKKAIFIESEIWPIFLSELKNKGIPSFLVNARMSKKTYKSWEFLNKFGINIFNYYDKIFAQSKDDFSRLKILCKNKVFFFGNLKSQGEALKYDEKKLQDLKNEINERKFWVAASTHKGEEEIVINIHKKLKQKFPNLLTILIPRHPVRSTEILPLMQDLKIAQRSQNQAIQAQSEIYFVDTLGEMGLFYKLADFAFIAGSVADVGGHNPFEAIKLDCAVISGKNIYNFKDDYEELQKSQGCIIIEGEGDLQNKIDEFLSNKLQPKEFINRAKSTQNNDDIAGKIFKMIFLR